MRCPTLYPHLVAARAHPHTHSHTIQCNKLLRRYFINLGAVRSKVSQRPYDRLDMQITRLDGLRFSLTSAQRADCAFSWRHQGRITTAYNASITESLIIAIQSSDDHKIARVMHIHYNHCATSNIFDNRRSNKALYRSSTLLASRERAYSKRK